MLRPWEQGLGRLWAVGRSYDDISYVYVILIHHTLTTLPITPSESPLA